MKKLLVAEYGMGSETYDFTEVLVDVDENNNITKVYNPFYTMLLKLLFILGKYEQVYYGHGYGCRAWLHDDLCNKKITLFDPNKHCMLESTGFVRRESTIVSR